eukprot:184731-Alexandrium_andersonii.AAC.1
MCIRDRRTEDEGRGQRTEDREQWAVDRGQRTPGRGYDCTGRTMREEGGCLLYTSDAADDM